METVEFRFKKENTSWEDTPVDYTSVFFDHSDINKCAKRLSKRFSTEVRWNFKGLSQGHYVNVNDQPL